MAFVNLSTGNVRVHQRETACCAEGVRKGIAAVAISASVGLATLLGASPGASASVFHFSGSVPPFLGPGGNGRYLSVCPSTPNCISTSSDAYSKSYVPPWTYHEKDPKKTLGSAVNDMKEIISNQPGAQIVEERPVKGDFGEGYYIRAEFESKIFGFVDDFEVLFQPQNIGTAGFEKASGIVDYRSASRLGEGDFDVNRKRVKAIRVALQERGWKSIGFR
ncbi:hypothetical protein NDN08_004143 [Rhodosorus marinus]|uniref:DUF1499 domain-containing protein n=1 Tax=Rhodosorus marinus TaxID=101924 RepID=A0AAV8UHG6_9RHOD|nr:hypothetical protein NDN08_004143 [Rhodosorus marinus]